MIFQESCFDFAGKTLLPQYLGMYRLTVDNVETYMVVMRNIFSNHLKIHKKYDLKGSTGTLLSFLLNVFTTVVMYLKFI